MRSSEAYVIFDVTEDGFDFDITLDSEHFGLLRKQVLFGLLTVAAQAEDDLHASIAPGTGTFKLEGTGDVLVVQLTA